MSIFKIDKNRDYTVMSNYHLRDKNLSYKAKGMLSFMLSLPDDWDYSLQGLISLSKESRDAIRNILDELKAFNYLKIEKIHGENGKFEYLYTIFEKPCETPLKMRNSPDTGFPYVDNPDVENHPQINTNIINTNNKIDNKDKIDKEPAHHSALTWELINLNYISEDDISSFYFDELFKDYLSQGKTVKQLHSSINYIVSKTKERNFIDEDGNPITNKYGYFKNAIESNFRRMEMRYEPLYPDDPNSSFYDDYEL